MSKGHGDHLKILFTIPSLLSSNVITAAKPSWSLHSELSVLLTLDFLSHCLNEQFETRNPYSSLYFLLYQCLPLSRCSINICKKKRREGGREVGLGRGYKDIMTSTLKSPGLKDTLL